MNTTTSAALVRRWVALYTRGLSDDVRTGRRDEIESDLWSQAQEGLEIARPDGAVAGEILARLVLGIPADVSWRIEQAGARPLRRSVGRRATMGSRFVGLVAVLGGLAMTISLGVSAAARPVSPDTPPWRVVTDPTQAAIWAVAGITAILAMSVATAGLALLVNGRIPEGVAFTAGLGCVGGIFGLLGAYPGLFLVPMGSAILIVSLAREHLMSVWIAGIHAFGAAGFLVTVWVGLGGHQTGPWGQASTLLFAISWILIGTWVLRGIPDRLPSSSAEVPDGRSPQDRPAAPSRADDRPAQMSQGVRR